ncbi:hypothetical protein C5167_008363 [Papaver somniferum]|uniref:RRM domain-containing protein n=1 Tax=Papaver somniferum TaxID=3469 RepID=A0A4Y7JXB1_PAPSO|nr:hypothetical protein C5167_008363 [Papaver somniferum]
MAKKQRFEDDSEDTESETDSYSEEEGITKLLEPFTRQQLISIIRSISTKNTEIISEIQQLADQNPSHLKIFIHGLSLDTTPDNLRQIFSSYGEIEDCNVVIDNKGKFISSRRCYGFILYKHRKSVIKALKEPIKKIGNRITACNLASSGPIHIPQWAMREEILQRKIFVGNVNNSHFEITAEKLYKFFSKYGEIEEGPFGFDKHTGEPKGYALFIYETVDGVRKALEEPVKNFNGHPLYCEIATCCYTNKQKLGSYEKQKYGSDSGSTESLTPKSDLYNAPKRPGAGRKRVGGFGMRNQKSGPRSENLTTKNDGYNAPMIPGAGRRPRVGDFGMKNRVGPGSETRRYQVSNSGQVGPSGHGHVMRPALVRTGFVLISLYSILPAFFWGNRFNIWCSRLLVPVTFEPMFKLRSTECIGSVLPIIDALSKKTEGSVHLPKTVSYQSRQEKDEGKGFKEEAEGNPLRISIKHYGGSDC